MSNYLIPSLETLPVEIIHRVFDNLDAQTILSSVRATCRRLQAFVNSYNRFVLNFKQISKPDFELICRLIDPANVISLTLSHDKETLYQIVVFMSRFQKEKFSRVRSLALIGIEQQHLQPLLKYVNINFLISFTLKLGNIHEHCRNSILTHLSSIIAQPNLRRFDYEIPWNGLETSIWPVQCTIQHLRIGTRMTFYPRIILRCLPVLQTLVVSFLYVTSHQIDFTDDPLTTSFHQLKSLTLENVSTKIETLEMLLLLVPSLTHLKLIRGGNFLDGNRWERFIQAHLPFLNKFDFFIQKSADVDHTRADIESIIKSFQTPFWLDHKKWFVTGEYNIDYPRLAQFYSLPICMSSWIYESASKKVSLSTSAVTSENEPSMLNNITAIQLNFQRVALNDIPNKTEEIHNPLFPKVEKLEIDLDHLRLSDWPFFISALIDLTRIIQIKLPARLIYHAEPLILTELTILLRQTCNLSSLYFCFPDIYEKSDLTAENICLMVPSHVRHLATPIKNFTEIKTVLERFDHLSSVMFSYEDGSPVHGFIKWLKEKRNGSAYHITGYYMWIWLGKKFIEPKEIKVGAKRIKLS